MKIIIYHIVLCDNWSEIGIGIFGVWEFQNILQKFSKKKVKEKKNLYSPPLPAQRVYESCDSIIAIWTSTAKRGLKKHDLDLKWFWKIIILVISAIYFFENLILFITYAGTDVKLVHLGDLMYWGWWVIFYCSWGRRKVIDWSRIS